MLTNVKSIASTDRTQETWDARREEAQRAIERGLARGMSAAEAVRLAKGPIRAAQRARVVHQAELCATASPFAQTA